MYLLKQKNYLKKKQFKKLKSLKQTIKLLPAFYYT